jgi:ribosomal protein S27E
MNVKHAFLVVECKGCRDVGRKTTIALRYLGVSAEQTPYSVEGLPLSFKIPCEDCNKTSRYEKEEITVMWQAPAPPADFHNML